MASNSRHLVAPHPFSLSLMLCREELVVISIFKES
jgi:hypothetical protein